MSKIVVVIPCYNEERRLRPGELLAVADDPDIHLLFVDDGSTDSTPALLRDLEAAHPAQVSFRRLPRNRGKAEAVRQGMLDALSGGSEITGFLDADASTPVSEVRRLIVEIRRGPAMVILGARVALLGSGIRRSHARHFLGRMFATAASVVLALPVYDTQCGAKLFRDTPALRAALARPFRSRWAFDVELIARLLGGQAGVEPLQPNDFLEVPIRGWRDVEGSKVTVPSMVRAGLDLIPIAIDAAAARRRTKLRD